LHSIPPTTALTRKTEKRYREVQTQKCKHKVQ
jgi:hypothetical protein